MRGLGERLASLPALSLRELRVLAARLGLGRYGALTRQSLVDAIRSRIRPGTSAAAPAPLDPAPPAELAPPAKFAQQPATGSFPPAAPVSASQPDDGTAAGLATGMQPPQPRTSEAPPAAAASQPRFEPPSGSTPPAAESSWVVLQPQPDQWAEVRWHLASADRAAALAAGGTSLAIRLSDVTGSAAGAALPHALQEVSVDSSRECWLLPIPLAGRSYRVELGFRRSDSSGWLTIATSAVLHLPELDAIVVPATAGKPFDLGLPLLDPQPAPLAYGSTIHENLYQAAASAWRRQRVGSEVFLESELGERLAGGAGQQASAAGFWPSGRQDSGIGGVQPQPRRFWLVADAELIVYAATEPSALLTIGDQPHPLSAEGTMRVHVPFPDGEQRYPIRALAADGEQSRNITLQFVRTTPSSRTNTPEQAIPEWF